MCIIIFVINSKAVLILLLTDKIDVLMFEKGINKSELSRDSGIPYMTIVNFYEKGTDNVKLSTLKKLANFFNCSLDFIADDDILDRSFDLVKKIPTTKLRMMGI
jgi:DNA-binding Xre family transcriptional regulator